MASSLLSKEGVVRIVKGSAACQKARQRNFIKWRVLPAGSCARRVLIFHGYGVTLTDFPIVEKLFNYIQCAQRIQPEVV